MKAQQVNWRKRIIARIISQVGTKLELTVKKVKLQPVRSENDWNWHYNY